MAQTHTNIKMLGFGMSAAHVALAHPFGPVGFWAVSHRMFYTTFMSHIMVCLSSLFEVADAHASASINVKCMQIKLLL